MKLTNEANLHLKQIEALRASIKKDDAEVTRLTKEFEELVQVFNDAKASRRNMIDRKAAVRSALGSEALEEIDRHIEEFEARLTKTKKRMIEIKARIEELEKAIEVKNSAIDGLLEE